MVRHSSNSEETVDRQPQKPKVTAKKNTFRAMLSYTDLYLDFVAPNSALMTQATRLAEKVNRGMTGVNLAWSSVRAYRREHPSGASRKAAAMDLPVSDTRTHSNTIKRAVAITFTMMMITTSV